MRKSGKTFLLATAVSALLVFNACNKEEASPDLNNALTQTSAVDYLKMAHSFNLSTEEELTSGREDDLKSAEIADCLTVTVHENKTGEFWPRSWTLDYGTENCECFLGNTKRGKIHVSLSDWWRNEGSLREITFEDFYFNDNKLEGTKTILNTGTNEDGNLSFTKNVSDAKMIYAEDGEMSWECEKYSELIEGNETFRFADDVWSVTGSGAGVNLDENSYTMTITTPLIYQNGCFFPVSGIIEIDAESEELKIIDYGDGECDNLATVTVDDQTETLEM